MRKLFYIQTVGFRRWAYGYYLREKSGVIQVVIEQLREAPEGGFAGGSVTNYIECAATALLNGDLLGYDPRRVQFYQYYPIGTTYRGDSLEHPRDWLEGVSFQSVKPSVAFKWFYVVVSRLIKPLHVPAALPVFLKHPRWRDLDDAELAEIERWVNEESARLPEANAV